jgi:putative ABC transport system permease protein
VTAFSFLKQILHDVRHQKLRTLLTLLGITWGTVSVSLLVAFGEGLEARIRKNQAGLGENIVIAWPSRTSLPFEGLGKGRQIRVDEEDIEVLRREIPAASFTGEYTRNASRFRRERVRLSPQITANDPVYAVMRNVIPGIGGRYVNELDVDRKRRVVFLGNDLARELFGEDEPIGETVMLDNVPFLVVGVMQEKAQDSSYSGRDKDKAFIPASTHRALFGDRYVENFIFQVESPERVAEVKSGVYEVLGRLHRFDPQDEQAVAMWDTTEAEKFFSVFFGTFKAFLGIIGSFTLIVAGIGVSNIMYVVVEERTREVGIKLAVGARPRYIQVQFLIETLVLTAAGGALGLLVTLGIIAVFPASLDEYVGTPMASPLVVGSTTALLGLIGLAAGYFPARRASLLDPVVALKL